jgi:hypothetical protein
MCNCVEQGRLFILSFLIHILTFGGRKPEVRRDIFPCMLAESADRNNQTSKTFLHCGPVVKQILVGWLNWYVSRGIQLYPKHASPN